MWQQLETVHKAAQANPEDGQEWLNLANVYRTLSTRGYNHPSIFSAAYLSLGVEAYQKAADLMPEHPTPRVGLALLSLLPYMTGINAPSDVMGFVQMELQIAKDLEAKHPDLAEEGGLPSSFVDDVLSFNFYDITATAEFATSSTAWAKGTEAAALMLTPSQTSTREPSLTPTVAPSPTPQPSPTTPTKPAVSQPGIMTGNGGNLVIILAAAVIGLIIVGYLVLKRK
jgi:hypothetical protein